MALVLKNGIDKLKVETKKVIDLDSYEKKLLLAAEEKSSTVFTNADMYHAARAFSVLFKNTEKSIKIIADGFSGDVSNDYKYCTSLKECLHRPNVKAEVLVLHDPNFYSRGFQEFLNARKELGNVKIKKASQESINIINAEMNKGLLAFGETHNMAIFDDNKYRLEYLPSQYAAFLGFNDKSLAKEYANTFNAAFSFGTPLPE